MQELNGQLGSNERKKRSLVKEMLSMAGLSASGSEGQLQRLTRATAPCAAASSRCFYVKGRSRGSTTSRVTVRRLNGWRRWRAQPADCGQQAGGQAARVDGVRRDFYLAIPPTSFSPASRTSRGESGWTRWCSGRIDHFLGEETLLHLLPLRFFNSLQSAVWSRQQLQSIVVNVKERLGLGHSAADFDQSGVLRDTVHNLLSILALLTMDELLYTQDDALHPRPRRRLDIKMTEETGAETTAQLLILPTSPDSPSLLCCQLLSKR